MKYTNAFIIAFAEAVYEIVNDKELKFPAKVNYAIQKNFKTLYSIYQELEIERVRVCQEYSTGLENGVYLFEDAEKRELAEKELNDLMVMEQEVNIMKFSIDALGDIELTSRQMDVLMNMIKDDEDGQE